MCVLSIKVPIRKKSGNLFNDPCMYIYMYIYIYICTVSWGCRIHRLLFSGGVWPHPNKCPGYDTKQFDGEIQLMLELWGMWSKPSPPLLPGPLWSGVIAFDRVLSMGQIELNCVGWNRTVLTFKLDTELFEIELFCILNWIVWSGTVLTVSCGWVENYTCTRLNCLK